jgi:hypothetical protein
MQVVSPDDPAWLTSFPHRVEPSDDEWFPGLLLRCDDVNHWSSGTTLRYLLDSTKQQRFGPRSNMIVVPFPLRQMLAYVVRLPQERILATTYQTELTQLYGIPNPHSRTLNAKPSFHLCPACMAQRRLLKRTLALPHLSSCSLHGLELQNRCQCGKPLRLFSSNGLPFTCAACGLDWADLPQIPLAEDVVERDRHLNSLYDYFLVEGTPKRMRHAVDILRMHEKEKSGLSRREHPDVIPRRKKFSLGYLVNRIVQAGLSSRDILPYW